MIRTVGELRAALAAYPDTMAIVGFDEDGVEYPVSVEAPYGYVMIDTDDGSGWVNDAIKRVWS